VSIKFNVVQCEHCTLSLINTFAESWIAEYKINVVKTYAKIASIHNVVYQTRVLLLFTLKVIFTGRYFLLLLKYSSTVLRTALSVNRPNLFHRVVGS